LTPASLFEKYRPEVDMSNEKNVIIAAACRKLGKTLLAEKLTRVLCDSGLVVNAFKLSRSDRARPGIDAGPGRRGSDTWRLAEAGAASTALVRFSTPGCLASLLTGLDRNAQVVVWESNTLAGMLYADAKAFISAPGGGGKNPELASSADLELEGPLTPASASDAASGLQKLLADSPGVFTAAYKTWVCTAGIPVLGSGRAALLRSIAEHGSLLGASRSSGISYKRAWVMLHDIETRIGCRLTVSERGGLGGGGTVLTPFAYQMLDVHDRASRTVEEALRREGLLC
jgi:molybdate transport system regulatory protein